MRRGQATVELALGTLVFVGVVLIGIHMAEYAQLSLKVQEAQTFAVWDAATRRVQSRTVGGGTSRTPFNLTMDDTSGSGRKAERRYRDFDGVRNGTDTTVVTRALTRGSRVQVECRPDDDLSFRASPAAAPLLWDVGGLRCESSAEVRAIRIPRRYMMKSEGGFFREEVVRADPMKVCGMGLPVNGNCRGALAVLSNDWGFVNEESNECRLGCADTAYKGAVRTLFGGGGGGAGAAFATQFAGAAPVSAGSFFFSYSGEESEMKEFVGGEGIGEFVTGGGNVPGGMVDRLHTSGTCFLGRPCP